MSNTRTIVPSDPNRRLITITGRNYDGGAGPFLDMPTQDCVTAGANGWFVLSEVGTTSQRPALTPVQRGYRFTDTTISAEIVWSGTAWFNVATGAAV